MLFYLATLQSIPTDVYEAAAIDGASAWRTFWKITFPLLKPGHFFVARRLGHRRAEALRPGVHRLGRHGRPELLDADAVLYMYQTAINDVQLRLRGGDGRRPFVIIFVFTLVQRLLFGEAGGRLMATADRRRSSDRAGRPGRRPRAGASGAWSLVYALLLALALLYFVPFFWSVSTSFKTLPESVGFDLLPHHPTLARLPRGADEYDFGRYTCNSAFLAGVDHGARTSSSARSAATRSRACASRGARCCSWLVLGDADDPRPAPPRPGVPDAHELAPDRDVPRATS